MALRVDGSEPLRVGLSWDLFEGCVKTDLDCAALAFDSCTTLVDACFYNQLEILNGSIKHSGDERDGNKEGFDEVITIDMPHLPTNIHVIALVTSAYEGGTLSEVETARATFQQEGAGTVCEMGVTCGKAAKACSTVVALLYRTPDASWALHACGSLAAGRNFSECYNDVLASLASVVDPVLLAERRANMNKTFNMKKNDVCELPSELFISGEDLFVGLGWDTKCDLDAGILITDKDAKQGAKSLNIVNYRDKSFGRAVVHHGDNVSGEGAGDDERIDIDLDYMPDEVGALWIVVNIYTSGITFEQVKGAYIRLVAASNGHVFARFELTNGSVSDRGLVLAKLTRNAVGRWCIHALGEGCGGQTACAPETRSACGITGTPFTPSEIAKVEAKASSMHTKCRVLTLQLKGVALAAKDSWVMGGKSDPYYEVWDVTHSPEILTARSNVVKACLNPEWKVLETEVISGHSYMVRVWDYDRIGSNDLIGQIDIGTPETFPSRLAPGTRVTLSPKQEAGDLQVVSLKFESITVTARIMEARQKRMSSVWICSSDPLGTL